MGTLEVTEVLEWPRIGMVLRLPLLSLLGIVLLDRTALAGQCMISGDCVITGTVNGEWNDDWGCDNVNACWDEAACCDRVNGNWEYCQNGPGNHMCTTLLTLESSAARETMVGTEQLQEAVEEITTTLMFLASRSSSTRPRGVDTTGDSDPSYAATLLDHAKQLLQFAFDHPGKYTDSISTPVYGSSNYYDEMGLAKAWMAKATGDPADLEAAKSVYDQFASNLDYNSAWINWDDILPPLSR